MKENKVHYNYKGVYCQRLIRVLKDKPLTLNEIMIKLRNQTKVPSTTQKYELKYNRHPSKNKVKQILTKYPIFKSLGTRSVSSGVDNNMLVNVWTLSEEVVD